MAGRGKIEINYGFLLMNRKMVHRYLDGRQADASLTGSCTVGIRTQGGRRQIIYVLFGFNFCPGFGTKGFVCLFCFSHQHAPKSDRKATMNSTSDLCLIFFVFVTVLRMA